jgi:glycosyltransferase involved in cell wall biosynthesis
MRKKVAVLQLIDQLGTGGAEILQSTLAASIDRDRFDWHVITLRPPGDVLPRVEVELREMGVPISVLNQKNVYDLRAVIWLNRYIRRHEIDIIHTHLEGADIVGGVAGLLARKPVVSTVHLSHNDIVGSSAAHKFLLKVTARWLCKRIAVVAESMREETAEWLGVPLRKVIAIPNGVDTGRFRVSPGLDRPAIKRTLAGGDGQYPLVINVARLFPQKSQEYLVRAAKTVLSSVPEARFAIVGNGPREAEITGLVHEEGLDDRFFLAGRRDDVPDVLAAADLFALSSMQEGLPVALLEALAAGCPVVSTDVGGVSEIIRHNVTGLLVPPANPEALASAIVEMLSDPKRARSLAAKGQELVQREYSMQAWGRKWQVLYLHVLGRR